MPETITRTLTATVLVVLTAGWYGWFPEPAYRMVLFALFVLAGFELIEMSAPPGARMHRALIVLTAVGWYLAPGPAWLVFLGIGAFLIHVGHARRDGRGLERFLAAAWLLSWLGLFVWVLDLGHVRGNGFELLAGLAIAVWISDSAAYGAGRVWGRHRLCPGISPGKSVEGLVAGVTAGTATGFGLLHFWAELEPLRALLIAAVAVCSGVLGDLSESSVKRLLGVKDSGNWLPGHGGLLDRIDALLMALPAGFLVWRLG